MFRVGMGYDVHRLVDERPLILGGVNIPYTKGLEGHSDADVLTHAVMDALLGAMALGDLGTYFPDNQEEYHDISSLELLSRVAGMMEQQGYRLVNLDSVIIAQKPRLLSYTGQMKDNLAGVLKVFSETVGIKSTTNEGLDAVGAGEGIAAQAITLLEYTATTTNNR